MQRSRLIALSLCAYTLVVWAGIEFINAIEGNILPGWHQYAWGDGSGYGQMRGNEGEFQDVLLLFGIWVYPASIAAAYLFLRLFLEEKRKASKLILLFCTLLCLVALGRFLWLGVFRAGLGDLL